MDLVSFLGSVNKISLIAFFFMLGILVYEIILFRKEAWQKTKPKVPNFQDNLNPQLAQASTIIEEKTAKVTRPNNLILIVSIVLVILFGIASFIGFFQTNSKTSISTKITPTPLIDFVTSKGIKIYNNDFQPIPESSLGNILPGEEIIIGVETIGEVDIDRARLRVNKQNWDNGDITLNYSDELKVYYKRYTVATGESKLKIEAQLHSSSEGWLGD